MAPDESVPPTSPPGHGLVLVRGSAKASARWLRRGLVAVSTTDLQGWTGISLRERVARTQAPYDVGLEVLAARPVPPRSRPSLGFFDIDGCAVVTAHPRGWRAQQRWLVWQPRVGVRRTPELPALPLRQVIAVAGSSATSEQLAALLTATPDRPIDVLIDLLRALGLPGEQLLRYGAADSAQAIEPSPASVRRFDSLTQHEVDE